MKLYRKMEIAGDQLPVLGTGSNMLGVRPRDPAFPKKIKDVDAVNGSDPVTPGKGMSAFDSPGEIPSQVRGVMWEIDTDDLPVELLHVQRGKRSAHYQIEPAREMTLDELQRLLACTRDFWLRV